MPFAGVTSAEGPNSVAILSASHRIRFEVRPGRVRAVLPGVREEPGPVELSRLQEPQQLVVVLLGLARVADDERRTEGGVRMARPDGADSLQEPVAVTPATHTAQVAPRHVLQ